MSQSIAGSQEDFVGGRTRSAAASLFAVAPGLSNPPLALCCGARDRWNRQISAFAGQLGYLSGPRDREVVAAWAGMD